jgi:hypothetical protein
MCRRVGLTKPRLMSPPIRALSNAMLLAAVTLQLSGGVSEPSAAPHFFDARTDCLLSHGFTSLMDPPPDLRLRGGARMTRTRNATSAGPINRDPPVAQNTSASGLNATAGGLNASAQNSTGHPALHPRRRFHYGIPQLIHASETPSAAGRLCDRCGTAEAVLGRTVSGEDKTWAECVCLRCSKPTHASKRRTEQQTAAKRGAGSGERRAARGRGRPSSPADAGRRDEEGARVLLRLKGRCQDCARHAVFARIGGGGRSCKRHRESFGEAAGGAGAAPAARDVANRRCQSPEGCPRHAPRAPAPRRGGVRRARGRGG